MEGAMNGQSLVFSVDKQDVSGRPKVLTKPDDLTHFVRRWEAKCGSRWIESGPSLAKVVEVIDESILDWLRVFCFFFSLGILGCAGYVDAIGTIKG